MVTVYPRVFISNLPYSVDAERIKGLIDDLPVVNYKLYTDQFQRFTGNAWFGFESIDAANEAVKVLNSKMFMGRRLACKLSLLVSGTPEYPDDSPLFSVFVTNVPFGVTAGELNELFEKAGTIVRSAIYTNHFGFSRGIASVSYGSQEEADRAIKELNDETLGGRQISVRAEREKRASPFAWCSGYGDPSKTLYVSNLQFDVTENQLKALAEKTKKVSRCSIIEFAPKVHSGNAVLRFYDVESATEVLRALNGYDLEGRKMMVSYARYPVEES